jgi:hypothetical protein
MISSRPGSAWHDSAVADSVLVYSVRAEFADPATRERYLDWLRGGHCLAVVREGGAMSGEVTVLENGTVESRYVFGSRAAFDAYEAGPGIALRAHGATLFPPGSGVTTSRALAIRVVRVPD